MDGGSRHRIVSKPATAFDCCRTRPDVTGIHFRGRPYAGPVRAAVGADADQIKCLRALPAFGRGVVLKQHEVRPVSRAIPAQMRLTDSVIDAAGPVSVTTARWPGSGPAVSHTGRRAMPTSARAADG